MNALIETILGERRNEGSRVSLQIGNVWLNSELFQDEKGVRTFNVSKENDPKAIDQTRRLFNDVAKDTKAWEGQELHVRSHVGYTHRLALIAELKAAFITAFAAFGYGYAFDPRLRSVRDQIRKPSETIIEWWTVGIDHSEFSEFVLFFVRSLPALVVKLGKSSVLLPWISGPNTFYEDLSSRYQCNESAQITGNILAWPSKLEMAMDFLPKPPEQKADS